MTAEYAFLLAIALPLAVITRRTWIRAGYAVDEREAGWPGLLMAMRNDWADENAETNSTVEHPAQRSKDRRDSRVLFGLIAGALVCVVLVAWWAAS